MSAVVGLSTSRAVWSRLENTFSHRSKSREIQLKDDLQTMKKNDKTVPEFSRDFKTVCDQLAAMGRPVDDLDKLHWYLRGLGSSFSIFSTTQLSLSPLPIFDDVVPKAESYEIFVRSLESTPPLGSTAAAFTTSRIFKPASHAGGRGECRSSRGGQNNQRTRPIRCQICRREGHYASTCRDRYTRPPSASLVEAFTSCSLNDGQDSVQESDEHLRATTSTANSTLELPCSVRALLPAGSQGSSRSTTINTEEE
ncbi:hypothetical protein F2P56_010766 [Juglans regia]|uniref:Uncharacterized protein LOC108996115 n=2 Tax=Juglans regia TaxID=51240 RepID=A0A2I4F709_JUGRE|nr:uncharacterized protein LOC108996115 [Juglans regia]KAF5470241.1 hypothetical protein F2P56_010766 [Juglans regia]